MMPRFPELVDTEYNRMKTEMHAEAHSGAKDLKLKVRDGRLSRPLHDVYQYVA